MFPGGRIPRLSTHAAMALAALALVLRVLIPSGYMLAAPDPGYRGVPQIVLCTAQGQVTVALDELGGPASKLPAKGSHKAPGDTSGDHPCPFASAAAPLTAPASVPLASPPVRLAFVAPPTPAHQRPGLGLAAPPPPTTGPPALV